MSFLKWKFTSREIFKGCSDEDSCVQTPEANYSQLQYPFKQERLLDHFAMKINQVIILFIARD